MAAARFVEQLNTQIGNEFAAHNQYLACAVYYDALTMPQMAAFFYGAGARGARPRDDDGAVPPRHRRRRRIPGVEAPAPTFDDVVAPVELALAQEKRVTEQINGLLRIARDENDFASEQFMQWFIKEQVEEVATMSDLLAVVTRNRDDIEDIEEYVAREQNGGDADPTAPRLAGAEADAASVDSPMSRVIVVGAGVVGLTCAVRLRRPDTGSTCSLATCRWRRPRRWPPRSGTPTGLPQDRVTAWAARRTPVRDLAAATRRAGSGCAGTEVFASASPTLVARGGSVARPGDACRTGTRRLDLRDAGRGDAGVPRWLNGSGRRARRHRDPAHLRPADRRRRRRQLLGARRPAARRRHVGCRCAVRCSWSSRSVSTAGGWMAGADVRRAARARHRGRWHRRGGRVEPYAVPATAAEILDAGAALVPALARRGCCGTGRAAPGAPAVRLERVGDVVHCYGHGGAGVTLPGAGRRGRGSAGLGPIWCGKGLACTTAEALIGP